MPWLLLIQIILLVGWYAIPAMATVPAWIIFLPLLPLAAVLTFTVGVLGVIGLASVADLFKRKRRR